MVDNMKSSNYLNGEEFLEISTNDVKLENFIKHLLILGQNCESVIKFDDSNYIIKQLDFTYDFSEQYSLRPGMEILKGRIKDTSIVGFLLAFNFFDLLKIMLNNKSFNFDKVIGYKNSLLSYSRVSNFKDEFSIESYQFKDFYLTNLAFEQDDSVYYCNKDSENVVKFYNLILNDEKSLCKECEFSIKSNVEFGAEIPVNKYNNLNRKQIKSMVLEIKTGKKEEKKIINLKSEKEKISKKEK